MNGRQPGSASCQHVEQYIYRYASPLGELTLASDGQCLTGLWIEGQRFFANALIHNSSVKQLPIFVQTCQWLDIYFGGQRPDFTPPLAPAGSLFRQKVWEILLSIPYGQVVTYGSIAKKLADGAKAMSAQAVGGAVGHNPISIIIPCHRVIGAHGNLVGYGGGISKKIQLLKFEHIDTSGFSVPKHGFTL